MKNKNLHKEKVSSREEKMLFLSKISSMDERIEQLRKYNLWDGNTIATGYERTLYTEKIAQYMGNRIIKVLTGQRRVGKSILLRQIASRLVCQGVNENNILIINREKSGLHRIAACWI